MYDFLYNVEDGTRVFCLSRGLGFFFQAEDGIRDLVRSRGLGDVYEGQVIGLI